MKIEMSDLFFLAIPLSLIVLLFGLSFNIFEIVVISGFLLSLLMMTLIIFASHDLDWLKDRPVRPSKQVINVFMQRPEIPRRYAAVSYDEYEEEDEELEEDGDPFADLDIIDNYGFLD